MGAWVLDSVPGVQTDPLQLLLVGPGGILTDASDHGIGYGAWTGTGAGTADITFDTPLVDPAAGFLGFVRVRGRLEVAADGQTISGTYTVQFPTAMAQAAGMQEGEYGPNDVTGQRIAVESMGMPVGPLPQGPGPSAAPGASPAA